MTECAKLHELISNRVGICNELLGCRYHHATTNPVRFITTGGESVVRVLDTEVGRCRGLDRESLRKVYDIVDSWSELIWDLSRYGYIKKQAGDTLTSRIA